VRRFIEALGAMVLLMLLAWVWPRSIDDIAVRYGNLANTGLIPFCCCLEPFLIIGLAIGMVVLAFRLGFVPQTLWLYIAALLFGAMSVVIPDLGPPGLKSLSFLLPWALFSMLASTLLCTLEIRWRRATAKALWLPVMQLSGTLLFYSAVLSLWVAQWLA
jgi:hypothetical protein